MTQPRGQRRTTPGDANVFKILGMAEEGICEQCGTTCPRRRVAVQRDGGDVQLLGVNCAAAARFGSKAARHQAAIRTAAEAADRQAAAEAADRERRFNHRIAGPVDAGWMHNPAAAANERYRKTGRRFEGSYLAADAAGHVIRIDGTDQLDVELFHGRGFTATTAPIREAV